MIAIGLLIGFVLATVILVPYVLVTTSGWYHDRYHSNPPSVHDVVGGCNRCLSLWRQR